MISALDLPRTNAGRRLNESDGCPRDCDGSGWVSASGYAGPSMLVQLVVDAKPVGKPIIGAVHRAIAGDHGFILHFPCELAAGEGKHSFAAVARVNASASASYKVGEKCATESRQVAC